MITLNEIGADTPNWKLNLNAHPYGAGNRIHRDAEVEHRRGLVLREHHCGHAPDAHPPFLVHVMGRYNFDVKGYAEIRPTAYPTAFRNWTSPRWRRS